MQENEVIIVDNIPDSRRNAIVMEAIRTAIISFLFSTESDKVIDLNQSILNKAHPEIANGVFRFFCAVNGIKAEQGLYTFFNNKKWNFRFGFQEMLIENSSQQIKSGNSDFTHKESNFITLDLNTEQEILVKKVCNLFKNKDRSEINFEEDLFWAEFNNKGSEINFSLKYVPQLIIMCSLSGGYLDNNPENNNAEEISRESNFNISQPSLLTLFPHLQENIKYGFVKRI